MKIAANTQESQARVERLLPQTSPAVASVLERAMAAAPHPGAGVGRAGAALAPASDRVPGVHCAQAGLHGASSRTPPAGYGGRGRISP